MVDTVSWTPEGLGSLRIVHKDCGKELISIDGFTATADGTTTIVVDTHVCGGGA